MLVLISGCSTPNRANIELRRQNQELRSQVEQLQRQHEADAATIRVLEARGQSTVSTLPNERLSQLFTVHGLQLGRLTGADPDRPNALKAYVVPTDGAGQPIKAAGAFVVEAFDLAAEGDRRIGRWEFPIEQAAKLWYGQALLYTYVLPLPLESMPQHPEITLKVRFTDGLTGRMFTVQRVVKM